MEPLSVTASILAILGAARRLSKGVSLLKAAKDAPESLDDLLLHLSGIEEVLQAIQDVSTEPSTVSPGLTRVLGRTKAKLVEMESLIQYTLTEAGENSKVDRWQWLRKRGEVENLQRQLDALRNDLTALICTQNFATLQRVSIYTEESWAVQQRHNRSLTEKLARSEAAFAFLCNKIEESSATQRELTRVLGEFRVTRLKPAIDLEAVASAETTMALPEDPEMRPRMRARSELRMQTLLPLRKCLQGCPCGCHKFRRVKLPSWASALFGSGYFGFRGLPFWRTDCNYRPCKHGVGPLIMINYFLPPWLSRTMLYAWFTSAPLCPPEFLIRIYQVVDYDNFLVHAALEADLKTLQKAFATGEFSPYVLIKSRGVLRASEGNSLLHLAALSYYEEASVILRFLLSIGLDPKLNNSEGISAMENCIDKIALSRPYHPWRAKGPAELDAFPAELLEDVCEKKGFSEIHKIVWGISYENLDTKVRACLEALDGLDSHGYTPLDYAIQFGNSDHVRVLLSHGADIGRRPYYLFWTAVESGNCASTQLLLDRGLRPNDLVLRPNNMDLYPPNDNLNSISKLGLQNFPYYISNYDNCNPAMDKLLINYGFNFNPGVSNGFTTLMACCRGYKSRNGIKRMKLLLEHGIDPEVTDRDGQTAIHHALCNGNVPAFETLIKYGARLDARTSRGETVLHVAVERTREVAMVHALSKAGIMNLDLDARRDDGESAFNALRRRAAGTERQYLAGTESQYSAFLPWTRNKKYHIEVHIPIIRAFEALFQEIQEHQGVPLEDRYPALHIAAPGEQRAAELFEDTYPASSDYAIHEATDRDDIPANHDSNEPICAPPGAWPEWVRTLPEGVCPSCDLARSRPMPRLRGSINQPVK